MSVPPLQSKTFVDAGKPYLGQTAARAGLIVPAIFPGSSACCGCTPKQFQTAKALSNKFSEYYLGSSVSVRSQ